MEKVWRPFSLGWERRPVALLNGARSGSFRENHQKFVKECKSGNSFPFLRRFFDQPLLQTSDDIAKNLRNNKPLTGNSENWHTLRNHSGNTAI